VPRHVARLVTWLVAPLVVDYSVSRRLVVVNSTLRRLVVDYFAFVARPGASARHTACHAARRATRRQLLRLAQARRRLLCLRRASGCLGMSRGSSRGSSRRSSSTSPPRAGSSRRSYSTTPPRAGSSSTTSPPPRVRVPRDIARLVTWIVTRLVVDYFAYAARLGASARRAAHRLSSTTSPTPRHRVPRLVMRLVAWLVAPLIVDYFAYIASPVASARCAARRTAHRRLLLAAGLRLAATLALL
jgi:hypothetical protein